MPDLGKIFGILALGRGMVDSSMINRLLSGVAAVAGLTIITGMMVGTLIIGIMYVCYLWLVSQGLPVLSALFVMGIVTLLIILVLCMTVVAALRKFFNLSHLLSPRSSPLLDKATQVAEAFLDGVLHAPHSHPEASSDPQSPTRL